MAKYKHTECKGHVSVGLFNGKTFRKVCITADQPDNVIEENTRFAKEMSDQYEARHGTG